MDTFKEAYKKYPDIMNGLLIPGRWDQQMSPNISARRNPMLAYMNPMEKEAAQHIANNLEMEVDIWNTTISATEPYGSTVHKG